MYINNIIMYNNSATSSTLQRMLTFLRAEIRLSGAHRHVSRKTQRRTRQLRRMRLPSRICRSPLWHVRGIRACDSLSKL